VLVLILKAGGSRYALESSAVVEVIPRVKLQKIARASSVCVGVFQYRGEIAPVVDLAERVSGVPCEDKLSTRIVVLRTDGGATPFFGLMVDAVMEARRLPPGSDARGVHDVITDADGIMQWLSPATLAAWAAEAS
jgi:chemotaxis-related protein WspB